MLGLVVITILSVTVGSIIGTVIMNKQDKKVTDTYSPQVRKHLGLE